MSDTNPPGVLPTRRHGAWLEEEAHQLRLGANLAYQSCVGFGAPQPS
jgi:hypothetical protein